MMLNFGSPFSWLPRHLKNSPAYAKGVLELGNFGKPKCASKELIQNDSLPVYKKSQPPTIASGC